MTIIKQEIKEKSLKLKSKWTIDPEVEIETLMADEVIDNLSREIQEEIDWGIMCDMMVKLGYTKVEMKWPARMHEMQIYEIKKWCRENLQGNYRGQGSIWMFEKEKDASMFILRWS